MLFPEVVEEIWVNSVNQQPSVESYNIPARVQGRCVGVAPHIVLSPLLKAGKPKLVYGRGTLAKSSSPTVQMCQCDHMGPCFKAYSLLRCLRDG